MPARPFYFRTGGVSFSPPGVDYAGKVAANLAELGIPHWRSSGKAWNALYPAFSLPDDYDVVFEPDAGMLAAARALALMVRARPQTAASGRGCSSRLRSGESISTGTAGRRDRSGRIRADRLIVSAGAG